MTTRKAVKCQECFQFNSLVEKGTMALFYSIQKKKNSFVFSVSESNDEIREFSPKNVIYEDDSSQYLIKERILSQGPEHSSLKGGWTCEDVVLCSK